MNGLRDALLLYAVTDSAWLRPPHTLATQVAAAVAGGATIVQLREKGLSNAALARLAAEIRAVTDHLGVSLIVNDSLDAATSSGAAGLHIGQKDGDVARARAAIGKGRILGVSVSTVEEARAAVAAGADYLGVGAIFPTSTKSDADTVERETLAAICASVKVPVVAIGGITDVNAPSLAGTGIAGIAVVSALFARPDSTRAAAELMLSAAKKAVAHA